jgi:glutathione S-transferase
LTPLENRDGVPNRCSVASGATSHGQSNAFHQQQELFFLVAARLAARQVRGARFHEWSCRRTILTRKEIPLLAVDPVPCLTHDVSAWDTLATWVPERNRSGLLLADRAGARALSCGVRRAFRLQQPAFGTADESQLGFPDTRSGPARKATSAHHRIWRECLATYSGPYLFGKRSMADAMYAPVVTRFLTYDVDVDKRCTAYCELIMKLPEMTEWIAAAKREPEEIDELDMEF